MDILDDILGPSTGRALAPPNPVPTGNVLDDLVGLPEEISYDPAEAPDPLTGKRPVRDSKDLRRILAIPRRSPYALKTGWENPALEPARNALQQKLALPGCDRRLRDVQVWALTEFCHSGGGLAPIGVGHGKTLVDLLLPMVMPRCKHALLFFPPNMRAPFFKEWRTESKRWRLPNLTGGVEFTPGHPLLTVVAYSELSNPKNSTMLDNLTPPPDLVICDEAHKLKDKKSACTKRFLRYLNAHPEARVVCLSGTLTTRSITEYAHLAERCLRQNSPLPLSWPTLEEWAGALDAPGKRGFQTGPGQLRRLCQGVESAREGFGRRIVETPGVISTTESSVGTSLFFRERKVSVPDAVIAKLEEMRGTEDGRSKGNWQRPDGEELTTAVKLFDTAKQVSAGFYLYWRYPRGEPRALVDEWFLKRRNWFAELRGRLSHPAPHMDSELLCTNAAIRWHDGYKWVGPDGVTNHEPPHSTKGPYPVWAAKHWLDWREIRDAVHHVEDERWIDDFLAQDAAAWARANTGLVWVHNGILGDRIAELAGTPYYAGGAKDSEALESGEKGDRSVVLSIMAHHASKNLQDRFSRNLIVQNPSSGRIWEQMVGRTHRQGQTADEVVVEVYRHTKEYRDAWDQATRDAEYGEETKFGAQKLLYGTVEW